jgi:sirohydrochlorin ferrochelatase
MAHGSRAAAANEEFLRLVEKIASQSNDYAAVQGVFLELCEPGLSPACKALHESLGIVEFDLYPLFFNAGRHVQRDIPKLIADAEQACPGIHINALRYFGANDNLANLVVDDLNRQTSKPG